MPADIHNKTNSEASFDNTFHSFVIIKNLWFMKVEYTNNAFIALKNIIRQHGFRKNGCSSNHRLRFNVKARFSNKKK